ncbi:hypothetical protein OG21DRAFT_1492172 [Imleria badia]|nr:hypothetical protein OG21DRAFT_1492172 [Imleria badia]
MQHVVQYTAERGIDVLLEIDTPGHTAILGASYPDYKPHASEPPAGQLCFASTLPSTYFSTGGEDINKNCCDHDPATQQQLRATNTTLTQALAKFMKSTHGALTEKGKTPDRRYVGSFDLSEHTFLFIPSRVYKSSKYAAAVAKLGYYIVHTPASYFYLMHDCGSGSWFGDDPTGNGFCAFKTWSKSYTFDLLANLTESQYSLVLGGAFVFVRQLLVLGC